jgi:hypothetical protein
VRFRQSDVDYIASERPRWSSAKMLVKVPTPRRLDRSLLAETRYSRARACIFVAKSFGMIRRRVSHRGQWSYTWGGVFEESRTAGNTRSINGMASLA